MIEARFDDLTGESPSFRLTDPAGVLEAMRPEDVIPTLVAAEGAAARGLWVAGFVTYEAAPGLDPSLVVRQRPPDDPFSRLPLAWFAMFQQRQETVLPSPRDGSPPSDAWVPTVDRTRYDLAIAEIREHIAAGDTYQVNHTLRLRSIVEGDERGLYRDLCYAQRGAHGAYLNAGRYRIVSASPELFFRLDGDRLTTRPMKGTAPRGRWPAEDDAERERLTASVKDRAENAMIVDLLRNDLGRIARPGTVRWAKVFEPERFETVWQLTSTVTAELEPGTGVPDVFRALFPSGSITGAPKVRTMEIIADLEDSPRGVYCGAVGFLAPANAGPPRASFNVAIRTVVVDAESGTAEYGVGGGITWDSSPAGEYDETVAKARVLTARRPPFELLESMRRDPGEPIRRLEQHVERLRDSATYFGYAFDEAAVRASMDTAGADDRPSDQDPPSPLTGRGDRGLVGGAGSRRPRARPSRHLTTSRWIRTTSSCSTRRRCAAGTRTRARDTPTPTTRSSSTRAGRSPRPRSRTSPPSSTGGGGRLRSMRGSCPGPSARRSSWRAR